MHTEIERKFLVRGDGWRGRDPCRTGRAILHGLRIVW